MIDCRLALIRLCQWGAGTHPISISQKKCKYEAQLFHNRTVVSSMNKDRAGGGEKQHQHAGLFKTPHIIQFKIGPHI